MSPGVGEEEEQKDDGEEKAQMLLLKACGRHTEDFQLIR